MSKPIRLLILNYEFPPLGGGAATATKNILDQFKDRKDLKIDLLTSSSGEYKEQQFAKNIKIYYLNIGKRGDLHTQSIRDLLIYSIKALPRMFKLNNENNYDLVHAFFGIPCGFLAMLLDKPYIVSLRGSDVPFYSKKYLLLDTLVFQFLSQLIWRKAEFVVANSEGLRDLAYETIRGVPLKVVPNGIDLNIFKPGGKNRKFTVISTARLIERKGLKYLVKAFGQFAKNKKDVVLEMYGEGPEQASLTALASKMGVGKKVRFMGNVVREEMPSHMSKSHVFVLPSLNEGMSNSLLEALACGLPVIVTDVGGTKELVNSSNGFVVEKQDSKQIHSALERLYGSETLLSKMGQKSRESVSSMSWASVSKGYLALYEKVNEKA